MKLPGRSMKGWGHLDALVLVGLVGLVFGKSVSFPFLGWDDPTAILDNPLVRHPLADGVAGLLGTPRLGYPQPLTVLTQHLDFLVGGGKPWAFHLTNVLLHLAAAILVGGISRRLGATRVGSLFAAALFAVHPLVAEPVCWATGRKDLLAAVGVLLATAGALGTGASALAALIVGIVVALGAKPTGWVVFLWVLLPSVSRRERPSPRVITAAACSLAVATAYLPVAFRSHEAFGGFTERAFGDAVRFAMQHAALQLRNIVAPVFLSPVYRDAIPSPWISGWGLAGLATVGVAISGLLLARKRRAQVVFFGLAAALVAFAPASGLVALSRGPADSYAYLPLAGLALAAAPGLDRALLVRPSAARSLGALAVLVYAGLAFVQADVWRSSAQLWRPAVELYPDDAYVTESLAQALLREGQFPEGLALYERAVRLAPYPPPSPEPLLSLGFGCFRLRKPECAVRWYGEAVRHYPADFGRAIRLVSVRLLGDNPEYEPESRRALELAESTLRELAGVPEPERTRRAGVLFERFLGDDHVPALALESFARRRDVGEVSRTLLAFYGRPATGR